MSVTFSLTTLQTGPHFGKDTTLVSLLLSQNLCIGLGAVLIFLQYALEISTPASTPVSSQSNVTRQSDGTTLSQQTSYFPDQASLPSSEGPTPMNSHADGLSRLAYPTMTPSTGTTGETNPPLQYSAEQEEQLTPTSYRPIEELLLRSLSSDLGSHPSEDQFQFGLPGTSHDPQAPGMETQPVEPMEASLLQDFPNYNDSSQISLNLLGDLAMDPLDEILNFSCDYFVFHPPDCPMDE